MMPRPDDFRITSESGIRTLTVCPHKPGWAARITIAEDDEKMPVQLSFVLSEAEWTKLKEHIDGERS